ncbi:dual specificity protein phosphatase CDC14AB-like [Cimex lectularius]|uniref:protein-tyrosine-phosphatase n=1 Tax=Cimex lectularius TaxID=79782 RepID=A0A8I6TDR2_CIMLE|nr:dual specificity protein phosphatase CDC14AB-like [Cimex lectularius]
MDKLTSKALTPKNTKSLTRISPFIKFLREMKDVVEVAEYAEDRLYFITVRNKREMKSTPYVHFFNTDDTLIYHNFYGDFGPLNLGKLYRFCCMLFAKLTSKNYINKKLVYWTILDKKKRANAAFLISAFAVIYLNRSPRDAIGPILKTKHPIAPFVDANMNGVNEAFTIRIIDCLNGLNRAFYFGLVCFSDFDLIEYETYEGTNLDNPGDLSWIVPKKLLAFAGPCGERNGNCPVEFYIGYFKANQVVCVIRLNKSRYDAGIFINHGIDHFNMYFPDGSTPPRGLVQDFLDIVEKCPGAVAVHCKAGLGRTGCLIGAYLMKHYKMSSSEAIAWMRICRPGCVIGAQQTWLDGMQPSLWRAGETYRDLHHGSPEKMRQHKYGIYSVRAKTARENKQDLHSPSQYKEKYLTSVADFEKRRQFAVDDLSYFHFKERLKNKQQNESDLLVREPSNTQGDLLLSARLANLKGSRDQDAEKKPTNP